MPLYDRLMTEVRNVLPGVSEPVIKGELWEVLNDMCRDAYVWRESVTITPVADQTQYVVSVPEAIIVQTFSISHETMSIRGAVFEFDTLTLMAAPTAADVAAGDIYLAVALAPSLTPNADMEQWIPSDLWATLHQAFVAGIKARMFAQPAKPYSNMALAQFHHREFKSLKTIERQRAATGNTVGARRWGFPQFYVPSRR
jgi:hypothetical protein